MGQLEEVLSSYVVGAADRELPDDVVEAAVLHILDTIAASVSGTTLLPGVRARQAVESCAGLGDATVFGTPLTTSVSYAAMANGMAAHADETDDSYDASRTHPGCSIVPSAFAIAETHGRTGGELVRAVVLGYDICARLPLALWPDLVEQGALRVHSSHAWGGQFGAALAAGSVRRFDDREFSYLFAYVAQHASGIRSYFREADHVEKAYTFGGMPAFKAVMAVELVACGWAGAMDTLSGSPGLFDISENADPSALIDGLGEDFAIRRTKFKKYSVGSPAQSPVEGLVSLLRDEGLRAEEVRSVIVRMAPTRHTTVRDRGMANINIDYLLHVALEDAGLSFAAAHDEPRFRSWLADGKDARVTVISDASMGVSEGATVQVETVDGRAVTRDVLHVPGSPENPMGSDDIERKARSLLEPVLGSKRTSGLVDALLQLPSIPDVRSLRKWLRVTA